MGSIILTGDSEVMDQEITDGQFFVNVYCDGTYGVESIYGGELRGTGEEWILVFQALVPRLRSERGSR